MALPIVGLGSLEALYSTVPEEKISLVQTRLLPVLTSDVALDREVSVLKGSSNNSTLIKAGKIFAGVLIVTVATVAVAFLCLKFFPVLILALTVAGVICMIQKKNPEKVATLFSAEQALLTQLEDNKNEKGTYEKDEIPAMAKRREKDQNQLGAFSSFIQGQPAFPYTIHGVENHENTNEIFSYFANKAVGTVDPEQIVQHLETEGTMFQKRAQHICSFLKLLGDGNQIANRAMTIKLMEFGYFVGEAPLQAGELSTFCIQQQSGELFLSYVVTNEEIGIYKLEDMGQPDSKPVMRLKTSRRVVVSAPDQVGKVSYTIDRTFKI
jgi:hypothetical protein